MIYTLTLNPAVDRELTVQDIEFDTVLRATKQLTDVGGKGFNVSRMVKQLGGESVALGFVGGSAGKLLCDGLSSEGIATDFVWLAEESRANFSVVSASDDRYLKVNEAGPQVSAAERAALVEKVTDMIGHDDWCVMSGSLPPGLPGDFYADLIEKLNQAGAKTILDTSGEALRFAYQAQPYLVTPNQTEATELSGQTEAAAAAQWIRQMGVQHVIITQGSDGALLLDEEGLFRVIPPAIVARNVIGAGDALVGGLVFDLASGKSMRDALCWGVACGTVAASLPGTAFGDRATVEEVMGKTRTSNSTS